jgi:hypothetical protein
MKKPEKASGATTDPLVTDSVAKESAPSPQKPKKKTSLRRKLIALCFSLLLIAVFLGVGELCCRWFGDMNLQGNSANLFAENRFGSLRGNAPNTKGLSFDVETLTDENGFRVDPAYPDPETGTPLLILGDSVTFGCGVPEGETFVGRLRKHAPDVRFYNASVIGYGAENYEDFLRFYLPRHPEIRRVWLFVCLNDISNTSGKLQSRKGSIDNLKSVGFIQSINDYLRCRSKLYLWLRGKLNDSAMRYYRFDVQPYQSDDESFAQAVAPLASLAEQCKTAGVRLNVFTLPYQAQLRTEDDNSFWPQEKIVTFLTSRGVAARDVSPTFRELTDTPSECFLFADPMHLNSRGHEVLFRALQPELETINNKDGS